MTLNIVTHIKMTYSSMTFSIITFSILTFSIMTFSIMTFSMTLSILTFNIMSFRIITYTLMTFSIMTYTLKTFTIITFYKANLFCQFFISTYLVHCTITTHTFIPFRIKIFTRGRDRDVRGTVLSAGAISAGSLVRKFLRKFLRKFKLVAKSGRSAEKEFKVGPLQFGHSDLDPWHRDR